MMIGTDMKAFAALYLSTGLPLDFWPVYPLRGDIYIPLKDQPADVQLLYKYDPVLARKMLADAGYPTGLTTQITISAGSAPTASLLKDQWSKIGVTLDIVTVDAALATKMQYEASYKGTFISGAQLPNTVDILVNNRTTGNFNYTGWSNPSYDELATNLQFEMDPAKQIVLAKEAALIFTREAPYLPLAPTIRGHYWWPWLKNYYGERTDEDDDIADVMSYIWIDQNLKSELGYK